MDTIADRGQALSEESQPPVHRATVFIVVGLALMMMSVDATIVATALHALQQGLETSVNWAAWTLTAYSFGRVLMLPISGKLSERYGHRKVFLGSVLTFTLASLCCGLADSIFVLIALRTMQAAGGAGFTPSATGIIVDHFGSARDRAVSLFGSIFPIGAMIGPAFGGLLVTYWSWRGIFLVNVPIGLIVVLLALRYIPHDRPRTGTPGFRMDIAGILLLGVGLLASMLAVSYLGEAGTSGWSPMVVVPSVIAVAALWMFFRHITRSPNPFIAPHLVFGAEFGLVNLINAIYGGITIGAVALVPLYATNRYGLSAFDAGTLLIAQGVATVLLSVTVALMLRRTGYRLPLYAGGTAVAIGMLLLAVSPALTGIPPHVWLTGATCLIGAGAGAVNPASRNAGLQLAPEHSSTLAALRSLSLQIGSIVTVSVATAVLTASDDPGSVHAWIYVVTALLLIVALPLIARVPEHHGAW
ncbi:MAG: MFS transporter [Mesorhizobium sp.]